MREKLQHLSCMTIVPGVASVTLQLLILILFLHNSIDATTGAERGMDCTV